MSLEKHLWILRLTVLFMVRNQQVESILTRGPSDVVAVKGSTVVLPCYTDLSRPVYWDTEKAGDNYDNNWYAIYQGDPSVITMQFEKRFSMSVDSLRNQYNLTIHDVQMKDAGTYRCGDNFGLALENYKKGIPNQGATAELTVIGSNLTCSQNFSVNYTDGSDTLSSELINCSLSYEGRIIPTLRWTTKWTNGDGWDQSKQDYIVIQSHPTTDAVISTITSTIIVSSKRIGKTGLKCTFLTSSGYRTGFEQQSDNNSIPYFSSVTRGSVLIWGICIGALSFALIFGIGLAMALRRFRTGVFNIEWSKGFATAKDDDDKDEQPFDDSDLINFATADLHITEMTFYYRQWKWNDKVIGGIRVKYSDGTKRLHGGEGGKSYSGEPGKFEPTLQNEKITEVTIRHGCMIDGMSFKTNKGSWGPYGGDSGSVDVVKGCSRLSYLAVLKGSVYTTNGAPGVKNLQFGWSTNRN